MKMAPHGFAAAIFSLFLALPAYSQEYDVVITDGRVMDPETNYDQVANVGIRDGRIAIVTQEKISGDETIDA